MSLGYGFVKYDDRASADAAVRHLDGKLLYNQALRVHWAYQSMPREEKESKEQFQIFVGDLAATVSDQALTASFQTLGLEPAEARVMW